MKVEKSTRRELPNVTKLLCNDPPFSDNLMVLAIWKISTFLLRVNKHFRKHHEKEKKRKKKKKLDSQIQWATSLQASISYHPPPYNF